MSEEAPGVEVARLVAEYVRGMTAHERITACVNALGRQRHLRQVDIAAALGMERTSLGNRLRGRSRWTSDDLDGLARLFDVEVSEMLGGALITSAASTGFTRGSALMAVSDYFSHLDESRLGSGAPAGHATVPYHAAPGQRCPLGARFGRSRGRLTGRSRPAPGLPCTPRVSSFTLAA